MKYFVILSDGSYSDYNAQYYMGDREITQEEFDKKGVEIGDAVIKRKKELDELNEEDAPDYSQTIEWTKEMIAWLSSQGFYPLPNQIPEINLAYDDIPNSFPRKHYY